MASPPTASGPMASGDGRVYLAWDGLLQNDVAIRRELRQQGIALATRSDMELVLRLYQLRGIEFLSALKGAFACALWDGAHKKLILARDRFGMKPMVYRMDAGRCIFASEVKALLVDPAFRPSVNLSAIYDLVGHLHLSGSETAFEGVKTLPPGHALVVDAKGASLRQYWDLSFEPREEGSEADVVERFSQLLKDAVQRRLRGERPIGLALSGGIDSGGIAALAMAGDAVQLKTFALGFEAGGHEICELERASRLARELGTEHFEVVVKPADVIEHIPAIIARFDAPYNASLAPYFLAERAGDEVDYLLSGLGADELLRGYQRSYDMEHRVGSHLNATRLGPATRSYFLTDALLSIPEQRQLFLRERLAEIRFDQCAPRIHETHLADRLGSHLADCCLYLDFKTLLPNEYFYTSDISFSTRSIEVALPFLDEDLVDFVVSLPLSLRSHAPRPKYILRKALASILPPGYLDLPKAGFSLPMASWLRGGLRQWVRDLLAPSTIKRRGYFDAAVVARILALHEAGRWSRPYLIWTLCMVEAWAQRYLDTSADTDAEAGAPAEVVGGRPGGCAGGYATRMIQSGVNRPPCRDLDECGAKERLHHRPLIGRYIAEEQPVKGQVVAACLDIRALTFEKYVARVKKTHKGSALRHAKKADRKGYHCRLFPRDLHVPDIAAINHSKRERSGGVMTAPYRRSIAQLGGAPSVRLNVLPPACPVHHDYWWGIFSSVPGAMQGQVQVNERLLGYVCLRRHGNYALYSKIIGHGQFLRDGIMYRLHLAVMEWLCGDEIAATSGVEYLIYAGYYQGALGLQQWKKKTLFEPVYLLTEVTKPGGA